MSEHDYRTEKELSPEQLDNNSEAMLNEKIFKSYEIKTLNKKDIEMLKQKQKGYIPNIKGVYQPERYEQAINTFLSQDEELEDLYNDVDEVIYREQQERTVKDQEIRDKWNEDHERTLF